MQTAIDTKMAELTFERLNYRCDVQDGLVIVQDPVYSNGLIADYKEVILKTEEDLSCFLVERS